MEYSGEVVNKVSRDEIIWCYLTFLGRKPESEAAIISHLHYKSFKNLVEQFASSPEFLARTKAVKTLSTSDCNNVEQTGLIAPKQNKSLAMAEFEAGVLKVRSSPSMLTLETSSRCNLQCVMCSHAYNAVDRPRFLEEEILPGLEKFIRQALSIQLHGIGEPMISPSFWSILKSLPDDCDSSINTNLTLLDEQQLNDIIQSNLKIVNVSLDAARPETYRKIRGYSFEEVIGNIRRLIDRRLASGKAFPLLTMNMTLMRSNIEEVLEFIDLAAGLGAENICFWHLNRWPDTVMQRFVIERDGWVFDYSKEGLWNYPALSNEYLHKAEALALDRGIRLDLATNTRMYFDE